MANTFKRVIDRQMWVGVAPTPNAHAAGISLCSDLRNNISRNPNIYQLVSNSILNRYNIVQKSWNFLASPGLGGTFAAGAGAVFAPSANVRGSIGAGCTTQKIVTTTAITSIGTNMLANRGGSGDYGFRIRIIGNASGSAGKVEERWCIANTSGTTPTIFLDSALSFTPVSGDTYEILSGSAFFLGAGALAANIFRSMDVATNAIGAKTYTNLASTIATDFAAVALDEQYVPFDAIPGEGMITGTGTYNGATLKCLTATATAASSITGQTSGGDNGLPANEYRNFQIRIVEDTGAPTAVNQRRIIASHTGGTGVAPVYTLGAAWTVTPSSTAKYVIELPNLILLRSSATAVVYTYNYNPTSITNGTNTIAADAWHVTYFGNAPAVHGAGTILLPAYGIRPDANYTSHHGWVYSFRGGNAATCDCLNIAGGTTGSWETSIVYDGGVNLNTGTCAKYAPADQDGKFGYINSYVASAINQMFRFDVQNRVMTPLTSTGWVQSGTAAVGDRVATYVAIDGSDKYSIVLLLSHLASNAFELVVQT